MIDYASLYDVLDESPLAPWLEKLPTQIDAVFNEKAHGNLTQWQEVVAQLPSIAADHIDMRGDAVSVSSATKLNDEQRRHLEQQLHCFHPWRKGPYHIHGIDIDTEWRSDWKWQRLAKQIQPLQGRHVLDVGCGNGYHCWRMAGAGAELVIGIDPTLLFVMQYQVIRHFVGNHGVYVLPLGIEALPPGLRAFDTVFSMGVLYHRRSPMDHLLELRGSLRRGGELVLETLVVDGGQGYTLLPERRYATLE
ncbi:MAG: tRNA 5-methoxyuridine(34)/uridine 5-oxyacetic acid(34) synthase CmoB, partial [Gammaproteobacteria bacterium]|nr:tRNA 5-methoxyuridine(34)/uridine 5-oxyacetic acid(34) synthase CmoB [Gammaproteobacteria bacterium]